MYKLLIVDDEPLVQVGIKSMLDWGEINIELCGTASNGEIALSMIDSMKPDIVITDIKMPVMDGLTLLRISQEKYREAAPKFILLTSYEDFHMAKEAVALHAFEYLVKVDLTPESLKNTMKKAVEAVVERDNLLSRENATGGTQGGFGTNGDKALMGGVVYSFTEKYFISLLNNMFESEEQMYLQAEKLKIDLDYNGYLCCYGSFETGIVSKDYSRLLALYDTSLLMIKELAEKYAHCYAISLDMSHFALLFCFSDDKITGEGTELTDKLVNLLERIRQSLKNYYNVNIKCGIGTFITSPNFISESYQFARMAYGMNDADSPIGIVEEKDEHTPHNAFNISLFKADLTKAFEEYDSELLRSTIDTLSELLCMHPHHFVQALDAASNILYLSLSLLPDGKAVLNDIFKESLEGYLSLYRQTTVAQIATWLGFFADALSELFDARSKDYKNRIVIDVKNYINEHVYEKLTLIDVAAQFAISSGYLSRLFGKYSDSGFTEYINATKIKEAKRLLKEEHKKVYEVADILSFGSEFYFSKVFKKVEGITPTEYLDKR